MIRSLLLVALLALILIGACGDDDRRRSLDAGSGADAGADAGRDGASEDARSDDASSTCDGCEYRGMCYAEGESIPTSDPCERCSCLPGGGVTCGGVFPCDAGA